MKSLSAVLADLNMLIPGFFTSKQALLSKRSLAVQQTTIGAEQEHTDAATDGVKKDKVSYSRKSKSLIALALAFFLYIIARNSWLSDDAYITFRTVDNFIHGYGLTWNVDERVQVYTHPLWMFLLSAVYFCTHEIYYSALLLSITLSLIAVGIVALYLARSPAQAVLAVLMLAASKAFVDYSTSGLENPLTHLLIVLFMLVFFSERWRRHRLFYLALIAALATVNRMDTFLLFLPALVYSFYQSPRLKSVGTLLLGFVPFFVWEAFSLWYYGFLFPNTAYAKLDTGISTVQLLYQGVGYLISSSKFDPMLFIIIAAGFFLTIGARQWRHLPFLSSKTRWAAVWAISIRPTGMCMRVMIRSMPRIRVGRILLGDYSLPALVS